MIILHIRNKTKSNHRHSTSASLANSSMLKVPGLLCGSMPAMIISSLIFSDKTLRAFASVFHLWEKAVLTILKKNFSSLTSTGGDFLIFILTRAESTFGTGLNAPLGIINFNSGIA